VLKGALTTWASVAVILVLAAGATALSIATSTAAPGDHHPPAGHSPSLSAPTAKTDDPQKVFATTTPSTSTPRPATTQPSQPYTSFEPTGSSFISPLHGWVIGTLGCESCAALRVTNDGGSSWVALPAPPVPLDIYGQAQGAVSNVYFADQTNGFLYGPGLESTHNGGLTWSRVSLPPVIEITGGAGYAYALTETSYDAGAILWRTAAGSNVWSRLSLPETSGIQLYVEGSTLLVLQDGFTGPEVASNQVGRLSMSTDGGTEWIARAVPCKPADGGADIAAMAYGHPSSWLVDCFDNEQSSQEMDTQHHLYLTNDEGTSWTRLGDPSKTGEPGSLAGNGSGDAVYTTDGDEDFLDASLNSGRTWSTLFTDGGSFSGWTDLEFVDSSTAFVVGARQYLYRSDNGGGAWQLLSFRNSFETSPPPTTTTTSPTNSGTGTEQQCSATSLLGTATRESGAASHMGIVVALKNSGSTGCTLEGFPSVWFVDNSGRRLGSASVNAASEAPSSDLLTPSRSASITVWSADPQAVTGTGTCQQATAAGIDIVLPGQSSVLFAPIPLAVCTTSIGQPAVTAIVLGTEEQGP
jgi:photosystem II stability/assembly factor-like uncharacterized protein